MRVLIGALLVVLIAVGFAIAAMAAFRPQWLSGIVPGFSTVEATEPKRETAAPAEAAPRPAQAPSARPEASETLRGQQKASLPSAPADDAAKGQPAPIAPAESRDAATPLAPDPPLVEPQRPAKAPSAKQKRNNNPPAN